MALLKSRIGLGPPLNLLPREKTFCISSLHPYEIFQVAFSPVLSTQPCLCVFLSVALLAKSAFPGNAAWLGSAVPQPAVLGEGDLPVRPYGEAAGLGDRGDVGMSPGWHPLLGCTSTCIKDGVIWCSDAVLTVCCFIIPRDVVWVLSPIRCWLWCKNPQVLSFPRDSCFVLVFSLGLGALVVAPLPPPWLEPA